jgi:hypothetical protein
MEGLVNPLNAELNPFRHLLALVGAHHFVHVSMVRVKERGSNVGLSAKPKLVTYKACVRVV